MVGSVPSKPAPECAVVERTLMRLRETTFPGLEWVRFENDEGTGTSFELSRGQLDIGLLARQASESISSPSTASPISMGYDVSYTSKEEAHNRPQGEGGKSPGRRTPHRASRPS